jgi:hypothetical protein
MAAKVPPDAISGSSPCDRQRYRAIDCGAAERDAHNSPEEEADSSSGCYRQSVLQFDAECVVGV